MLTRPAKTTRMKCFILERIHLLSLLVQPRLDNQTKPLGILNNHLKRRNLPSPPLSLLSLSHLIHSLIEKYLLVAEEVHAGDEHALEGVEEVGGERPEGEEDPGPPERVRPHHVQDVGDAEQGEQEQQGLEGLSERYIHI